jgi:transposase
MMCAPTLGARVAESLHVDDGLWAVLQPLLPERLPQRIGRPRVDDRIAFTAILFVLVTGRTVADAASGDWLLRRHGVAPAA